MLYVRDTIASVVAHELGHNFGLGHSSARQCDAAVESATCRTAAYRDYYDVMGVSWAQLGSLNAPQAARLGVLPAAAAAVAHRPGAARPRSPSPRSPAATGTRALRLTDAEGVDYWLEYRTATGRDAWLGTAANRYRLQTGVLLRRAGGLPDTSLLLDGTPAAAADVGRRPPVGAARRAPVPVSGGDFTVVVQSVTAAGAVLTVTPAAAGRGAGTRSAAGHDRFRGRAARRLRRRAPRALRPRSATRPATRAPPVDAQPGAARRRRRWQSAADSSAGTGWLLPLAGAALAAAALLVVRTMRRSAARRA